MELNKNIKKTLLTIFFTFICTILLMLIFYFIFYPTLTIVFYKTECADIQISNTYSDQYLCAYFRLNTDNNHRLNVKDFSILDDGEYKQAIFVEYQNQTIKTNFDTYPNEPILKVYFKVSNKTQNSVIFVKYKDTKIRIGEFAKTK